MTNPLVIYGHLSLFLCSVCSPPSSAPLQAAGGGGSQTGSNKQALIKWLRRICSAQANKQTSQFGSELLGGE